MAHDGKVAIITGGARGIGYAIAKRLLMDGARVIIADIDSKTGEHAERELQEYGQVHFFKADISRKLDVHNLLAGALEVFGDVDILVNNAAIVHQADFLDISEDDFDRVLNINLKGSFLTGQAVARYMVEKVEEGKRAGTIINMSSVNAVVALPSQVAYSISKGGVASLTKVMALSLAEYGIRVNAVGPGSIMTDMLSNVVRDGDAKKRILERTPIGRIGDADEIASVVSFLASDEASYVTGQTIYADGGRLPLSYSAQHKEES